METFRESIPTDRNEFRSNLYRGEIFRIAASACSQTLASTVWQMIESELGDIPPRQALARLGNQRLFAVMSELRRRVYESRSMQHQVVALLQDFGWRPSRTRFDSPKLRAVFPGGHSNPAAAAVYYAHRDTWYANPACTVNWWIPLHDVTEEDSFCFYPEVFGEAVENDSERFDFEQWSGGGQQNIVGWQQNDSRIPSVYPRLTGAVPENVLPVTARRGDVLIFCGQHLHQTTKQVTDLVRYSIDFRCFDTVDYQSGAGPKNVDNLSTGCWGRLYHSCSFSGE